MPNPIYIVDVPELIAKWDFELNKDVNVKTIKVGDERKYWWKCEKGHSYPSSPDIQRHGKGCSVCAGKYILAGVNDFETWCKENSREYLLEEWDYDNNVKRPDEYTAKSGIEVNWVCRLCGNKWPARIISRTYHNSNCNNCSTARQTSFPEQAFIYYLGNLFNNILVHYKLGRSRYSLDMYVPDENIAIEYDGYNWHSSDDSEKKEKKKNEYCKSSGIRLIRIKELKEEEDTHIVDDTLYYYRDKKDDNLNFAIDTLIKKILNIDKDIIIDVAKDRGKIMEGYFTGSGSNSLAIKRPELIKEWDREANYPLSPYKIAYRSNFEVKWICPRGHHYSMSKKQVKTSSFRQLISSIFRQLKTSTFISALYPSRETSPGRVFVYSSDKRHCIGIRLQEAIP